MDKKVFSTNGLSGDLAFLIEVARFQQIKNTTEKRVSEVLGNILNLILNFRHTFKQC